MANYTYDGLNNLTAVAANVNYPSDKKLVCDAFGKVIRELEKFNEFLARQQIEQFESSIDKEMNLVIK